MRLSHIYCLYLCLLCCGLLCGFKSSMVTTEGAVRRRLQRLKRHSRLDDILGDKDSNDSSSSNRNSAVVAADSLSSSSSSIAQSASILPYAVLAIVPIIWGTYTPAVKSLYTINNPPPALIFNFLSYTVSFASLSFTSWALSSSKSEGEIGKDISISTSSSSSSISSSISSSSSSSSSPLPLSSISSIGGFELGMWLFLGSSAQVMGIQSTSAIKASILVQLTTVFVPIIESILGTSTKRKLTPKLWISCILAFISVIMISSNGTYSLEGLLQFQRGDLLIILSSLFYSMHVIRLGKYAIDVNPINLARSKAFSELVLSMSTIFICAFILGQHEFGEYVNKLLNDKESTRWDVLSLTVLWNGAITTAATMYCQSYGQRKVRPTEANLIYTSQPVWAILFAYLFLNEQIDPAILPAVGLLFSSIGISLYESNDDDKGNESLLDEKVDKDELLNERKSNRKMTKT